MASNDGRPLNGRRPFPFSNGGERTNEWKEEEEEDKEEEEEEEEEERKKEKGFISGTLSSFISRHSSCFISSLPFLLFPFLFSSFSFPFFKFGFQFTTLARRPPLLPLAIEKTGHGNSVTSPLAAMDPVLPSFTEFYRVFTGFNWFYRVFSVIYR